MEDAGKVDVSDKDIKESNYASHILKIIYDPFLNLNLSKLWSANSSSTLELWISSSRPRLAKLLLLLRGRRRWKVEEDIAMEGFEP